MTNVATMLETSGIVAYNDRHDQINSNSNRRVITMDNVYCEDPDSQDHII